MLFNTVTNYTDDGVKCTLSQFPDVTKLSDAADTLEGRNAGQAWKVSLCDPIKDQQDQGNPRYVYRLEELIESSPVEKVDLMDEKMDMSRQCALATRQNNIMLSSIHRKEYFLLSWLPVNTADSCWAYCQSTNPDPLLQILGTRHLCLYV